MSQRYLYYIGIGSNLQRQHGAVTQDSQTIMRDAVQQLAAYGDIRVSRLYQSAPMGPQDQPDYYNAVLALHTLIAPSALLSILQQLELAAGRVRTRYWGERTLDLDMLIAYAGGSDDRQMIEMQTHTLTLPHVGVLLRAFVVIPLLDLDDTIIISGQVLRHCKAASDTTLVTVADATWWQFF